MEPSRVLFILPTNLSSYLDEYLLTIKNQPLKGFKRAFLELESWRQRDVKPSSNYPLLLVFEDPVNHLLFMLNFYAYEKRITQKVRTFALLNLNRTMITTTSMPLGQQVGASRR